jgi:hypothetical protein
MELGEEDYHAEWIADEEAGVVNLYMMDGKAEKDVELPDAELTVNVTVDGKTQTFPLSPVREDGAEATAQFKSDNKALVSMLKLAGKGTQATLTVTIDGKRFAGEFLAHDHEHDH